MNELTTIQQNGQRVLTTQQLAMSYGADVQQIQQNFNNHQKRFEEGKHYYLLTGEKLKEFKRYFDNIEEVLGISKFTPKLYLWTEKGALRHAKILDTDKAWEVYEMLEETYFAVKEKILPMLTEEQKLQLKIFDSNTTKEEAIILFKKLQDIKNQEINILKPKATAWDQFINSEGCITFEEVAKMLSTHAEEEGYRFHISAKGLTKYLRENGVLSKAKIKDSYKNLPNAEYENYFNTSNVDITNGGKAFSKSQTKVKHSGIAFIYDLLKENNFVSE